MEQPTKRKRTAILMAVVVEYGRLIGYSGVRSTRAFSTLLLRHIALV